MERIPKWARTFASVIPTGPPPAIKTGTDFIPSSQYDQRRILCFSAPPHDARSELELLNSQTRQCMRARSDVTFALIPS
jgi:hypothetical protein